VTRAATATAVIIAAWAAAGGGGGGGTPEEALETFNGHMAAKDFVGAATVVYRAEWAEAPPAEIERLRAEYAASLADRYDEGDLDYGRAQFEDRARLSADEVEFTVSYPLRSRPTGPRARRKMAVRKIAGRWYYQPAPR
jgi:hypothetical protein